MPLVRVSNGGSAELLESIRFVAEGSGTYIKNIVYESGLTGYSYAGIITFPGGQQYNTGGTGQYTDWHISINDTGKITITPNSSSKYWHKSYIPNPWTVVVTK